jgi:stage V sporulation protein B
VTEENSSSRKPSLAKISGLSAIYLMAGKALNLGTVLLLSALLPIAAFGEFMYVRGMVLFWGPFMALGLTVTAMRRLPAYVQVGDIGRALGFLRTLSWTSLVTAVTVALILAVISPSFAPTERAETLVIALFGLPGFAWLVAHMQAARALGRVTLAYSPQGLVQPLVFSAGALALVYFGNITGPGAMAGLFAATMLVAAAIQAIGIWRMQEFRGQIAVLERRKWWREALPLTLSLAAQGVSALGPFLILGLYVDGAAIGIFGFYQAAMQGLMVFNTSVFGATNPRLSAFMAQGNRTAASSLLRKSRLAALALSSGFGIAGWIIIIYFGGIVQPAFTTEPVTLGLLLATVALNALSGPLGHVLVIEGRGSWEVASQTSAAAFTVALAFGCIPTMGLTGAALAVLAAAILRAVVTHFLVYGLLKYRL